MFTHSASTITATTHSHTLSDSTKTMSAKHATISFGVSMRRTTKPDNAVAHAPQMENTVISSEAESSDAPNVTTKYSGKKLVTP